MKIQGSYQLKEAINYICGGCNKGFNALYNYQRHQGSCQKFKINILSTTLENKINILSTTIENKNKNIENLKVQMSDMKESYEKRITYLEDKLSGIAEKATSRPTTTTTNTNTIQINQIIQNMGPLHLDKINEHVDKLTLDHHKLGAEGYAKFALEYPFKNKLVCTDASRNKFKYKNSNGDIVTDEGLEKCWGAFCIAVHQKSYNLAQQHWDELAQIFTEKEMSDNCPTTDWAVAIARYRLDKTSEFSKDAIDYIKKHCNDRIIN